MDRYICKICGHEYNPDLGEPSQKIAPGIAFEHLPPGWECPICGAAKILFGKS